LARTAKCPHCGRVNPVDTVVCQWCHLDATVPLPPFAGLVGRMPDGAPLRFDPDAGVFDIQGMPVTLDAVRDYDRLGQVAWEGRAMRLSAKLHLADPSAIPVTEYTAFAAAFALIPLVNVVLSSVLYYQWRERRPLRAKQINRLGWIVFAAQLALSFVLGPRVFGIGFTP
jgi:hypothetical protein